MKFSQSICTTFLATFVLAGCTKGGGLPLSMDSIGHLINAGGKELKAASLSEKDEDSIGQSVGVVLTSTYGVYGDDNVREYVTLVGLTVVNSSPNPGGNYVFGVLDTPEVNAYSGPNGYIFITRGALEKMKNEAELAGVLGHEIAHVCHHDGLHQVQAAAQQGVLSEALKAGTGRVQQFAGLADLGVDAITKTGYTQPQEFSADEDGVTYMTAAGYDPNSYLHFLQRLQQISANTGGQMMSTHPGIGERVKRVSDELAQMKVTGGATLEERFATNVPMGMH